MFSIHKINPMVRAVGTMGAVAAIVGGVTFAQINTTAPVTLSNNTLTAATASLGIGADTTCASGVTTLVQGMNFSNLQPGVPSAAFPFCLDNTGNTPLNVSAAVPNVFGSSAINPGDVSLHFTCGVGGATTGSVDFTTTVAALTAGEAFGAASLNNATNNILGCNVTATLAATATFTSGETLTPFDINFTGTTPDSATPIVFDNSQIT